ncbi:type VI secretion system membrane subunit TssM [Xylophilus sp. GOD-11R]|uniref:type VI secretion system membrane subunit TssM n=1 Tax=Xylophilus sp. GOD-11R TaxID=3089814 RepID=UPI00298C3767|nr:type VI secretion system membrane subunit TssM [Xylophilus sp. GOD-11R]WPB55355.1 type VI secretion system membrane subunit TssM [Xylophilus sp. GOD-11R]
MRTFFEGLWSRTTAWLLLVVVACVAVWVFGPSLAIGIWRPLEGEGARLAVMAAVIATALLALVSALRWPAAVLAAASLVWTLGPWWSVGGVHPLLSVGVRAAIVGAVLLAYALVVVWRALRAIQADGSRLDWLPGPRPELPPAHADLQSMRTVARRAMARLRRMRSGERGWHGVPTGGRRRYELPWFLLVGGPGAGKTSALRNAGLQFPAPPELPGSLAAERIATATCGWWFTHDAVLVDTAGRFSQQAEGTADAPVNAAGWRGLLRLLRSLRPRAPLNGGLLVVDTALLAASDPAAIREIAADMRSRLEEAREELGVRFPVYVLLSKADVLHGFTEYFGSLTSEARAQVWGFTLPWTGHGRRGWQSRGEGATGASAARLEQAVDAEWSALQERVSAGVAARLQEEFEPGRRQRLYRLPHEVQGLAPRLRALLAETFVDSPFDATATGSLLRGVYLCSAAQTIEVVDAGVAPGVEAASVLSRLMARVAGPAARPGSAPAPAPASTADSEAGRPTGDSGAAGRSLLVQRGYFLGDLLRRVVFPESHLVRPNLRLEARLRVVGWLGHALVLLALLWLLAGMRTAHRLNTAYLEAVAMRAGPLRVQMHDALAQFRAPQLLPDLLDAAGALPRHAGLDLERPAWSWRFGLYRGDVAQQAAGRIYASMQQHLLLPGVTTRMEQRLNQALDAEDARAAYETLRVYLMLFDSSRYAAADLRAWVAQDWQAADGLAVTFGGRAIMLQHLQALFSGERPVRSAGVSDAALVREAREWLDTEVSATRLYERAKMQLTSQAPADFSLVSAVGPQAGTLFARASGAAMEQGVPGLFTHEGYRRVWSPRVDALIAAGAQDDAWVMGRRRVEATTAAVVQAETQALADEVRRQYLQEYAARWIEFLDDVRPIGGANLAFDLNLMRQLAAPDSPITRLARAAARETTLGASLSASLPTPSTAPPEPSSAGPHAAVSGIAADVTRAAADVGSDPSAGVHARMERLEVDDRFASLREVVTGRVDAQSPPAGAAARAPALELVTGLVNEYYTALLVADAALSGGAVPAGVTEVGTRLRLEAQRLPAPLRAVLLGLGTAGAGRVAEGAQAVLRQQARLQLDRINGLLALQVTEPCRRAVDGRYPFVADGPGTAEVGAEDFQLLFAAGGSFDDYFVKNLLPYVELSQRPWRYREPASAASPPPPWVAGAAAPGGAQASAPASGVAAPTLTGELLRLLAESGPDLEVFRRAAQIRDAFFRDGGRRLGWQAEVKVSELDPSITELSMDFDGQGQRYAHGPVQGWAIAWPGPRGGASAELTASPRIRADTSTLQASGPWALQRLLERGRVVGTAAAGHVAVEFDFDGRRAVLDLSGSGSQGFAPAVPWLRGFRCPGARTAA